MTAHLLNFGGSFTQVNTWTTSVNGTQIIPTVAFGAATGDPIITGAHQHVHRREFPRRQRHRYADQCAGAVRPAHRPRFVHQPQRGARTKRRKQYGAYQPIVRNHQREFGLYFQDSWRLHPRLTFNYGVRWDRQNPPVNVNGVYTRPGYAGVWGVSGVGNLFKPGTLTGSGPGIQRDDSGRSRLRRAATSSSRPPSVSRGRCPKRQRPAGLAASASGTVIRAGYAINTIREDASTLLDLGRQPGPHPDPERGPDQLPGAVRRAGQRAVPQPCAAFARRAHHAELPAGRRRRQQRHRFRPESQDRLRAELGHRHSARIDPRHRAGSPLRGQPRHRALAPGQYQRDQYLRERLPERVQDGAAESGAGARLRVARPGLHVRQPQPAPISISGSPDSSRCPSSSPRWPPTTTPPAPCRSNRDRRARWPTPSPPMPPA